MARADGVFLASTLVPADGPTRELPRGQEEGGRHLLAVQLQDGPRIAKLSAGADVSCVAYVAISM